VDLRRAGPPPGGRTHDIREVTEETATAVSTAMGGDGERVASRLARGSRCFAAWVGSDVVGYAWVSTGPEWIGELELEIRPAAGDAYVWNCMVLGPHRRKGIYKSLLHHVVAQAQSEGLARLWIASIVGHPAEKADGDAGFLPVLRLSARRGLGLRLLTFRPADGADPAVVNAARETLCEGGRLLRRRFSLRRAEQRFH
jgi:GNAT superfamily N-acetyltransferase